MNNKEDKYQIILNAAIELMKEKGFEKTSISEIVKKAGVAQGTFYLYFASKIAIIPALAKKILQEQLALVKKADEESTTIYDTIRCLIEATFYITKKHRDVIMLCYSGIAYYNSFQRWEEIYTPYYQWLADKLEKAIANNEVNRIYNTMSLAKMIIGQAENTAEVFYFSHEESEEDLKFDKEQVLEFINRALS